MGRKVGYAVAVLLLALVIVGSGICCVGKTNKGGRQLKLSDFDFLEPGISREEVVSKVGEPDRIVGSGLYICQYDLIDGRKIMLSFPTPEGLGGAWIINEDGSRTDFFRPRP